MKYRTALYIDAAVQGTAFTTLQHSCKIGKQNGFATENVHFSGPETVL